MQTMSYIGLDVQKRTISYCVKIPVVLFIPKDHFPPHV